MVPFVSSFLATISLTGAREIGLLFLGEALESSGFTKVAILT